MDDIVGRSNAPSHYAGEKEEAVDLIHRRFKEITQGVCDNWVQMPPAQLTDLETSLAFAPLTDGVADLLFAAWCVGTAWKHEARTGKKDLIRAEQLEALLNRLKLGVIDEHRGTQWVKQLNQEHHDADDAKRLWYRDMALHVACAPVYRDPRHARPGWVTREPSELAKGGGRLTDLVTSLAFAPLVDGVPAGVYRDPRHARPVYTADEGNAELEAMAGFSLHRRARGLITQAMHAVEALGAHKKLTGALVALEKARDALEAWAAHDGPRLHGVPKAPTLADAVVQLATGAASVADLVARDEKTEIEALREEIAVGGAGLLGAEWARAQIKQEKAPLVTPVGTPVATLLDMALEGAGGLAGLVPKLPTDLELAPLQVEQRLAVLEKMVASLSWEITELRAGHAAMAGLAGQIMSEQGKTTAVLAQVQELLKPLRPGSGEEDDDGG